MPEDAGKRIVIREFLQQVSSGLGFIEDIWIEREVKAPGTDVLGFTQARSLSGRSISNLTEMLKDDLKHSFTERFFTFRFIAAVSGSGKTALLNYLRELIKVEPDYCNHSLVVFFTFNDLLSQAGSQSFGVKLYSYILTQTFWNLLQDNANVSARVKNAAESVLSRVLKSDQFAQLKLETNFEMGFTDQLNRYLNEKRVNFEKLFFLFIDEISKVDPLFTFVYLIDELDALNKHSDYAQDTRSIIRALINRASDHYRGKIRLMIYLVGLSDDVDTFIKADAALERRVFDSIVSLVPGHSDELEAIKAKITARIEGAYSGCQDFAQAWQEIQSINLEPGKDYVNLGQFCKKYAVKVIEIHENYFNHFDKDFNIFEDKARQLVEAECRIKWQSYLKKAAYYQLEVASTTKEIECHTPEGTKYHNFDCYAELKHNSVVIARAFGEAKNYELLSGHLQIFDEWLRDVNFKPSRPSNPDGTPPPPDLAFMIAPSCPSLLQQKLELKNIQFIESEKIFIINPKTIPILKPTPTITPSSPPPININNADKHSMISAFQGTRYGSKRIDHIMSQRPYADLEDFFSKDNSSDPVKSKLKAKFSKEQICF